MNVSRRPAPFRPAAFAALLMLACGLAACAHAASPSAAFSTAAPPAARPEAPPADTLRAALLDALRTGGHYAGTTLLDATGAARGDYDLASGRWQPYEVAWHTGQIIAGLLDAHAATGDAALLAHAVRAGDFWAGLRFPDGHPLAPMLDAAHGDRLGALVNFTTLADGTPGLFALSRATGNARYADVATDAGRWSLDHLYLPDEGLLYNVVDPATGDIWTDRSPHHDTYPATLEQVARPNIEGFLFADMYRHTGDARYRSAMLDLCAKTAARQDSAGLWMAFEPNDPARGIVHPRFNVWYAEALLECHALDARPAFLDAAARAMRTMARFQADDGTIYYRNYADGRAPLTDSPTGSAVSFAGLVWLRLAAMGYDEFRPNVARSLAWTLANRYPADHPDPNLAGGFFEIRTRRDGVRVRPLHRDIATAFGLRFLAAALRAHDAGTLSG